MLATKPPSWQDYRVRRRLALTAIAGTLPVVLIVAWLSRKSPGSAMLLLVIWFAFFGVANIWMNRFPCPRCGKPFFQAPFRRNPLAQHCLHCRWPKWASNDPDPNRH